MLVDSNIYGFLQLSFYRGLVTWTGVHQSDSQLTIAAVALQVHSNIINRTNIACACVDLSGERPVFKRACGGGTVLNEVRLT